MQRKYIQLRPGTVAQRVYNDSKLDWLLAANGYEDQRRRLFRTGSEEEQMLLMRHPVSSINAYAILGMLLGTLPPAAIFTKMFGYGLGDGSMHMIPAGGALFFICLLMNVTCAAMGYAMGRVISRDALKLEHMSWARMLLLMPLIGAGWGATAGVAGGFFFFGVGAVFGCVFGMPVGSIGFLMLATLHRVLERGGMIDRRHFVPLACGITAIVTSFILGL